MQSQPPASSGSPVYPLVVANAMPTYRSLILEPESLQKDLPQKHFLLCERETPSEASAQAKRQGPAQPRFSSSWPSPAFFPFPSPKAPGSLQLQSRLCQTQLIGHSLETGAGGHIRKTPTRHFLDPVLWASCAGMHASLHQFCPSQRPESFCPSKPAGP